MTLFPYTTLFRSYRDDFNLYPAAPHPAPALPQSQFQAFLNTSNSSPNEGWVFDSGATHHVTSDINSLASFTPYNGHENLQVGNGHFLPICNIGRCTLSLNGGSLQLNDVLHVPSITKNLISISKFTRDNDVLMEFSSSFCIVKDRNFIPSALFCSSGRHLH